MNQERHSKGWWQKTVTQWRRSGLSAEDFAADAGLKASTLRWWSSALNRGTRAKHGAADIQPIEIAVAEGEPARRGGTIEIAIGQVLLRCEVGTDVAYVTSLVRAIGS